MQRLAPIFCDLGGMIGACGVVSGAITARKHLRFVLWARRPSLNISKCLLDLALRLISWQRRKTTCADAASRYARASVQVISAASMDELVLRGATLVVEQGEHIVSRAGVALQIYNVVYTLTDSRNRLLRLRSPHSIRYFCRELLAYFRGSLDVSDGLLEASKTWATLSDDQGRIWSNYGYYVFKERHGDRSQYEWLIDTFLENANTRRALVNINQCYHKDLVHKDFPCNIALHFYLRDHAIWCAAYSRSEDVYRGVPYDLGFFSFLNELLAADLSLRWGKRITVGPTRLVCTFSQIYMKDMAYMKRILAGGTPTGADALSMPEISDPKALLNDILRGSDESEMVKWIKQHARFG